MKTPNRFITIVCFFLMVLLFAACNQERAMTDLAMPLPTAAAQPVTERIEATAAPSDLPAPLPDSVRYDSQASGSADQQATTRLIVKNGQIELEVAATDEVAQAATDAILARGGYVISQRIWTDGDNNTFAEMSYGIPVAEFEAAMTDLRGLGRVLEQAATGTDVTDEFVDLTSHLENLYATQAQLRIFLEQAQTTEETLTVYEQLTEIEGEINIIQGRLNFLSERAAFSTITLNVNPILPTPTPRPTEPPPTPSTWTPGHTARTAAARLQENAKSAGDFAIYYGIVCGPWLLLLVVLVAIWRRLERFVPRWRRRAPEPPPPTPPAPEPPADEA